MERERCYYVYIMASKSRVLYVGMTGFLMARVLRHRAGDGGAFTRKYRVQRLVYYTAFLTSATRLRERRRLRNGGGKRKWRSFTRIIRGGKILPLAGARRRL
jgi:putative endonuclease